MLLSSLVAAAFAKVALTKVALAKGLPLLAVTAPAAPAGSGAAPAGETGADLSFEGVGRAFLESLPADEREKPIPDPDGGDVDDATQRAPAAAEAAGDEGDEETVVYARDDGAEWNEKAQRWVKDKKFVEGEAPVEWVEAKAAADKRAVAAKAATKGAEKGAVAGDDKAHEEKDDTAAAAAKVVLPGISDRGEEDLEIEVDDPDVAARIKRLMNDGMRKAEFTKRMTDIDQRESRIAAYQEAVTTDPIGFHLQQMPKDQQIEVARALIVEHLDALAPTIEEYLADPKLRSDARVELRDKMTDTQQRVTVAQRMRAHATQCLRATEELVPEGTDPARAQRFMRAARIALADASDAGVRITPQNVNEVLKDLMQDYAFDRAAAEPPARSGNGSDRDARNDRREAPSARPVTDRAREVAARRPTKAEATATQSRIRRVQVARSAGARVVPPGAGAAPVQVPVIPPEAEADVASASKYLRQNNRLPDTWAGMASR